MPHDPQKYLYDMLDSCKFLLTFTSGKTVKNYIQDRGFRSAIERELQIIGEAPMQLRRIAPELAQQISESQNIIAFRHILVHGYDSLEPDTVWSVIEVKLSPLIEAIQKLLGTQK